MVAKRCGCSTECACAFAAGDGASVSGDGSAANPVLIAARLSNDAENTIVFGSDDGLYVPPATGTFASAPSAWQTATLLNTWANQLGTVTAYRLAAGGDAVELKGIVSHPGTPTFPSTVFQLAAGFRPAVTISAVAHSDAVGASFTTIIVASTGEVQARNIGTPAAGLRFVGVRFPLAA